MFAQSGFKVVRPLDSAIAGFSAVSIVSRLLGSNGETAPEATGHRHLLVLRFCAFNLGALALLLAAFAHGWIDRIVSVDTTYVTVGIFLAFLLGLGICATQVWHVSRELNDVTAEQPPHDSMIQKYLSDIVGREAGSRAILADGLRIGMASRISIVRYIANSLVLLGLIGTVLGFVIALSAVDPAAAGDVTKVAPMVAQLLQGMYVALYTTLVGAVLHLWLSINYHFLAVGAANLATSVIARGESRARF